jgi:hypothetical protein
VIAQSLLFIQVLENLLQVVVLLFSPGFQKSKFVFGKSQLWFDHFFSALWLLAQQ